MTYRGHIRNGAIVLDEPVNLPEGATVELAVLESAAGALEEEETPSFYEHYRDIIGIAKGLPPDAARNHDHYLYGRPKR